MADVNYVITIKSEGGGSSKNAKKKIASTSSGENIDKSESSGGFADFVKKAKSLSHAAPVGYALKYADLAMTTHINRIELRTGSSTLQEKISYEYGMAKRIAASGIAIIGGIASGNPVVAVAGAMSLVNIGVQQTIAQQNLNIAREVEGIGIQQANIRAGANGGRNGNF